MALPSLEGGGSTNGDGEVDVHVSTAENELNVLKQEMRDTPPYGPLVSLCRTLDQAKSVLTFAAAVQEKTLRSTVALTAARGRGKSAALGMAVATAISHGFFFFFFFFLYIGSFCVHVCVWTVRAMFVCACTFSPVKFHI